MCSWVSSPLKNCWKKLYDNTTFETADWKAQKEKLLRSSWRNTFKLVYYFTIKETHFDFPWSRGKRARVESFFTVSGWRLFVWRHHHKVLEVVFCIIIDNKVFVIFEWKIKFEFGQYCKVLRLQHYLSLNLSRKAGWKSK